MLSVISLSLRHLSLLWQVYYYSNIIKQRASFPSSSYSYRPTCYATTTTTNCWPLHIHREMMITKKKKKEILCFPIVITTIERERDSINQIKRALLVILHRVVFLFLVCFVFQKAEPIPSDGMAERRGNRFGSSRFIRNQTCYCCITRTSRCRR